MSEIITYNGSVCNINYHFVWCTKYRQPVLTFPEDIKTILTDICKQYAWIIRATEVMEDHIHLFITTPPFDAPSKIAKIIKGVSARQIFIKHPELKKNLLGRHLWNSLYYCGTTGIISDKIIKKYIANQTKKGDFYE